MKGMKGIQKERKEGWKEGKTLYTQMFAFLQQLTEPKTEFLPLNQTLHLMQATSLLRLDRDLGIGPETVHSEESGQPRDSDRVRAPGDALGQGGCPAHR